MTERDTCPKKRAELHCHTSMSAGIGLYDAIDILDSANETGSISAIAFTDLCGVQGIEDPEWWRKLYDIRIICGAEIYVTSEEDDKPTQCILIAGNETGRTNLFRIISEAEKSGEAKKHSVSREVICEYRNGILRGASCEGEVMSAILEGREDSEIERLISRYDYVEVQPPANMVSWDIDENFAKAAIERAVRISGYLDKPVAAVSNAHFLHPDDQFCYEAVTYSRNGLADKRPLYLRDTDEMLSEFEFLGPDMAKRIVTDNPDRILSLCDDITPMPEKKYPVIIPDAEEKLRNICVETCISRYGVPLPKAVWQRMETELRIIDTNGYASTYLIVKKMTDKSRELGYPAGVRASCGASFVAWLCGITDTNPLIPHYVCENCRYFETAADDPDEYWKVGYDLPDKVCPICGKSMKQDGLNMPVETFLGLNGDREPDFDINVAVNIRGRIIEYLKDEFGKDKVFRAGKIHKIGTKAACRILKEYAITQIEVDLPGVEKMKDIIETIERIKSSDEASPCGIIIIPENVDISEITPLNNSLSDGEEVPATHLEYLTIHRNVMKFDIMSHRVPAVLHELEKRTGVKLSHIPMHDDDVMSLFRNGKALGYENENTRFGRYLGTLGVPEFGLAGAWELLERCEPQCFGDLMRISALMHGTHTWKKNGEKLIGEGRKIHELLTYRDDIMLYMISRGMGRSDAFEIMERVRKGRHLTADMETEMRDRGVPEWYIRSCNTVMYMFPKGHAAQYVKWSWQMAYYKLYYPEAFYPAVIKYMDMDAIPPEIVMDHSSLGLFVTVFEEKDDFDEKSDEKLMNLYFLQEAERRGLDLADVLRDLAAGVQNEENV